MEEKKSLKIIHFNDVYELKEEEVDPVGGAARFKTAIDKYRDSDTLVVFSGDLFSPSLFSNVTKGEHMVHPMNEFGVQVACLGNHDFDIDTPALSERLNECKFPWLLSNVRDLRTNAQFGGGLEYFVMEREGLRVGFIGLAENEWLQILPISTEDLEYEDYVACSERLYPLLKDKFKCDIVIAVTHMRNYNDENLAEKFDKFDLILGGHDHTNECKNINGTYYVKSGSDFKQFSVIDLKFHSESDIATMSEEEKSKLYKTKYTFEREIIDVTTKFEQNADMMTHFEKYNKIFEQKMQMTLGYSACDLETTFKVIRNEEENFSNFVADVIRLTSDADCTIFNTGTIRSDCKFHKGAFIYAHLSKALPLVDYIVKVELTGEQVYKALENSVSKYPQYEGRFPAVSNITFSFDPDKPQYKRIPIESIKIANKPLELEKVYVVATKYYLTIGKDGFDVMKEGKSLTDLINADEITGIIRKFFEMVNNEEFADVWENYSCKMKKVDSDIDSLKRPLLIRRSSTYLKKTQKIRDLICLVDDVIEHDGVKYISINPKIESRIINLKKHSESKA